jgi:hypothetical protein
VAGAVELRRDRHSGRAGADDGDRPARAARGWLGLHPALRPGALDDSQLDLLDRDGVVIDVQHARRLARSRADQPGELGEVVRRVQLLDGLLPVAAIDEVVPVRDQVAQRAALVAEGHATLHAAPALALELLLGLRVVVLLVVAHPLARVALVEAHAVDLDEAAELSHG